MKQYYYTLLTSLRCFSVQSVYVHICNHGEQELGVGPLERGWGRGGGGGGQRGQQEELQGEGQQLEPHHRQERHPLRQADRGDGDHGIWWGQESKVGGGERLFQMETSIFESLFPNLFLYFFSLLGSAVGHACDYVSATQLPTFNILS